eukprot:2302685-Rhodomonas_salina.1
MDGEDAGPARAKLPILRRLLASGLPNPVSIHFMLVRVGKRGRSGSVVWLGRMGSKACWFGTV